ncbi:MAG: hypothetical protein N2110_08465 [Flavobacteriales bacterium]|nr:hypothetical protein [Flavobacteriales bacterium]MCX7769040.1 hypothetical protein [Flavobacteriales bacterium]MDW8410757.1 hypothetical protein [Flavobacteriales bacterium]
MSPRTFKRQTGRVPDAFLLVKTMSRAERAFHKKLRSILRTRSLRTDALFDLFVKAPAYHPDLCRQALGTSYTPHRAAQLLQNLKNQLLLSLRVWHERSHAELRTLAEKAAEVLLAERLERNLSGDLPASHKMPQPESQVNRKQESPEAADQQAGKPTLVQKPHLTAGELAISRSEDPLASFKIPLQALLEESQSALTSPTLPDDERRQWRRLRRWARRLLKGRPEKLLQNMEELEEPHFAPHAPLLRKALRAALQQRARELVAGHQWPRLMKLIQRARISGFSLPEARQATLRWLSEPEQ